MQLRATIIGSGAIALWSFLALFTSITGGRPAFQLLFLTFLCGGTVGLLALIVKGTTFKKLSSQPPKIWLIGIGGLFGYHFFYFTALGLAPVEDASLIAYLWPLLIVLLSPLVLDDKLRWFHIMGAFTAFTGAILLLISKGEASFSSGFSFGYSMALGSAMVHFTSKIIGASGFFASTSCEKRTSRRSAKMYSPVLSTAPTRSESPS